MGIGKAFVRDENNHIWYPNTTIPILKSQEINRNKGKGLFWAYSKKVKFIPYNHQNLPK